MRFSKVNHILFCLLFFISVNIYAQNTAIIKGRIIEDGSKQPVPFATIRLEKISGLTTGQLTGTISDVNGSFEIGNIKNGTYKLQFSSIGYKDIKRTIEIVSPETIDVGILFMQDSTILIQETVVTSDRIKGKSDPDKTTYYVNQKILQATGNTAGLLRHVPGVQVDLRQNISIEGYSDILLFVDGKEHEKSYINQLNPSRIDRIEVLNTPGSNYDGHVSGVINIILKKEKISGISGHFFSEIPTSASVVYSFPTFGLGYSYNKINLYTSYNGEINYEDIDETTRRRIAGNNSLTEILSVHYVKQKNLSHKFHYGIDYHLTSKDIFNFYGFYNHYSYEQDGDVKVQTTGEINDIWQAQKDENDKNKNLFNSLYYKHMFNLDGGEIAVDISNAYTRSENKVVSSNGLSISTNSESPVQTTNSVKVDFKGLINKKIKLSTGVKFKEKDMHDNTFNGFSYKEKVYAFYGSLNCKIAKFDFNLGLRAEDAMTKLDNSPTQSSFSLLPYVTFQYKVDERNSFNFSFRRSVNRPSVYLLNPYSYTDTPYDLRKGNPLLTPEFHNRLQFEYATRFESNFVSFRLFYQSIDNEINNLTYFGDNYLFVTQAQNLGDIRQCGAQFTGALKIGLLSVNPSLRVYKRLTSPNNMAKQYGIESKRNVVFESGLSTIFSFKKEYALSLIFQYATKKENIQDNAYCNALYFVSLDKTFREKLKVGIVSALPLAKTFVYQGSDIQTSGFSSEYRGNLKLPVIPLMFRLSYQFNYGKNRKKINREREKVDVRAKKGL